MKKLIGYVNIIFLLSLFVPDQSALADRPSGGTSRGSHGSGGSYRGAPAHGGSHPGSSGGSYRGAPPPGGSYRGAPGHGSHSPGYHRPPPPGHYPHYGYRPPAHGYYHYRGYYYRGYPGFGPFLPGLVIGGAIGWSLAPRYYYYPGPTYYYGYPPAPPPTYYYPPPPATPYAPPDQNSQAPSAEKQMYIVPRQGQSPEQQEKDHYECHKWAVEQTNFDPTIPPPAGRPESETARLSGEYLRALQSCLDPRGYDLR